MFLLARISSLFLRRFLSIFSSDFIGGHAVPTESTGVANDASAAPLSMPLFERGDLSPFPNKPWFLWHLSKTVPL